MVWELEFGFLFHVAGKAHFRILFWINDLIALASTGIHVQAPGTVTHLATFHFNAFHRDGDPLVSGKLEIPDLFLMAHGAGFRADILGALHLVVFQNFLEGFNVHFPAGRKKRQDCQNQNRENKSFTVHIPELSG